MNGPVIPKEKLSAYQRWELASFGEEPPKASAEQDAALLQQERDQARQQGHAEGFEQGRQAGFEAGRAKAEREAAQLRQVAESFSKAVARADEAIAEDLLALAMDLAKAMLKTALKVRPELVLPVVTEAIRYMPTVQQPALLVLNPQDAQLVRSHLKDELDKAGWRVTEDIKMEPGGCRVETATNHIDASIASRWQRLTEGLGRTPDWLE